MPSELNNYYRPEPAIGKSEKGSANGVATLDGSGLVPSNQLPSYVDDVEEYASLSNFPATGEIGKIYVAIDTNKSYRWSGSTYVELSAYALATQAAAGLMSAADKTKLDGVTAGAEPNPGDATQQASGLMSATDKAKLDGIATGATAVIVSDSLSDTSTTKALSAAKGKALNDQIANNHTIGEEVALHGSDIPLQTQSTPIQITESNAFNAFTYVDIYFTDVKMCSCQRFLINKSDTWTGGEFKAFQCALARLSADTSQNVITVVRFETNGRYIQNIYVRSQYNSGTPVDDTSIRIHKVIGYR